MARATRPPSSPSGACVPPTWVTGAVAACHHPQGAESAGAGYAMSFLSDTLNNVSKLSVATSNAVEARPSTNKPRSEDLFTFLANSLDRARQEALKLPADKRGMVELEARLGVFAKSQAPGKGDERFYPSMEGMGAVVMHEGSRQSRFFPGVTRGAWEIMKQSLNSTGASVSHSHEVAYNYQGHMRIKCEAGATSGVLEKKMKLMDIDVALPSAPYDLRLTLAVETEMGQEQAVDDNWESRRHKLRTTFKDPQGNATLGPWVLDMTTVTSEHAGSEEESSEVEIELDMGVCSEWIGAASQADADAVTSRLASRLLDTLQRLNPLESDTAESFLRDIVNKPALANAAQSRCALVGGAGGGRRFPGTMPVNLCRKDVSLVQQGDYWLAEKTDGVRYFLLVLPNQQGRVAVLLNRSMKLSAFPGSEALGNVLPPDTVLDGELVFNRSTNSYIFLIFDVLFWGPEDVFKRPYRDRLVMIHLKVIPTYEEAVKSQDLQGAMRLVGKKFYRRQDIARLFDRVVEESGHRVYRDPSCLSEYLRYLGIDARSPNTPSSPESALARYCHKTDGIVFQPNRAYQCSTDIHFFKWKWMDTVTIDFAIYFNQDMTASVKCQGQGQQLDLSKHITLEHADLMRLRADMAAVPTCRIAELGFSPETGYWTYKKLRTDKDSPNFFTTVCTTMLELAEAIDEEELQYRMMVDHPAKDDWVKQSSAMMKAALAWKRSKEEEDDHMKT